MYCRYQDYLVIQGSTGCPLEVYTTHLAQPRRSKGRNVVLSNVSRYAVTGIAMKSQNVVIYATTASNLGMLAAHYPDRELERTGSPAQSIVELEHGCDRLAMLEYCM
jgi:hypothetical protein